MYILKSSRLLFSCVLKPWESDWLVIESVVPLPRETICLLQPNQQHTFNLGKSSSPVLSWSLSLLSVPLGGGVLREYAHSIRSAFLSLAALMKYVMKNSLFSRCKYEEKTKSWAIASGRVERRIWKEGKKRKMEVYVEEKRGTGKKRWSGGKEEGEKENMAKQLL